jgi:hypothetical protein
MEIHSTEVSLVTPWNRLRDASNGREQALPRSATRLRFWPRRTAFADAVTLGARRHGPIRAACNGTDGCWNNVPPKKTIWRPRVIEVEVFLFRAWVWNLGQVLSWWYPNSHPRTYDGAIATFTTDQGPGNCGQETSSHRKRYS